MTETPAETRVPPNRPYSNGTRNTVADRLRAELNAAQATERTLTQTLQLETSLITTSASDIESVITAEETLQVAEARRDAQVIYDRAIAAATGSYRVALTDSIKRLRHGMTMASATFEAQVQLGNAQADEIMKPAKAAYDRQLDLAMAARQSAVAPAAAEYLAATRRLVEEFGQEVQPVRHAFDQQLRQAAEARSALANELAERGSQNSVSAPAAS